MALNGLFNETKKPTKQQIKEAIDQNICRCTGYNSIIRAATDVANGQYKE
jgi:xanthine dehydrogenase iron-sulfur cluster and FAD-binding subunit A